jgi:hypothetical protein
MENVLFNIGDIVKKKSNKPFKYGELTDEILGFKPNPYSPKNNIGAELKNSNTIVNLDCLILV